MQVQQHSSCKTVLKFEVTDLHTHAIHSIVELLTSSQLTLCSSLVCCLSASAFSCMDNKFKQHVSMNSSFFGPLSSAAVWQVCFLMVEDGVTMLAVSPPTLEGEALTAAVEVTVKATEGSWFGFAPLSPSSTS